MTEFIGRQPLDWQEVQKMMGPSRFFGPEDIKKHYGDKIDVPKNIPPPSWWNREVIDGPCPFYPDKKFSETHFVYFTFPTTIKKLIGLHPGNMYFKEGVHPKIDSLWLTGEFKNQKYHTRMSTPGWHALLIGPVPMSKAVFFENPEELTEAIGRGYELSLAVDRVTANIFYYHLNKKYIDKDVYVHCQDWDTSEFPDGSSVVVGAIDIPLEGCGNGIYIGHSHQPYADKYIQISASRKF